MDGALKRWLHWRVSLDKIFVFGSNLAGRHGKGSALEAIKKHGAFYGQGVGLQGMSYAIPTKDHVLKSLPLDIIYKYVLQFKIFATSFPHLTFNVVEIGCGLAGYKPEQIGPLFHDSPSNVHLPDSFLPFINRKPDFIPSSIEVQPKLINTVSNEKVVGNATLDDFFN